MEKKLSIEGMTCMHCSGRVQKHLESNSAISGVSVNLESKEAIFSCDDTIDVGTVAQGVTELGYPAKEK